MNQIKQKIKEIGLSQREISKRLGKNASYLAGVFRTGLSTAKQAELMDDLEIVAGGGTILSDEKLFELVDDQLEKLTVRLTETQDLVAHYIKEANDWQDKFLEAQEGNAQLRAESDKYFNELDETKCNYEMMGKFYDHCKSERWKYKDKYAYHFKLNFILILVIVIGLILWVLA